MKLLHLPFHKGIIKIWTGLIVWLPQKFSNGVMGKILPQISIQVSFGPSYLYYFCALDFYHFFFPLRGSTLISFRTLLSIVRPDISCCLRPDLVLIPFDILTKRFLVVVVFNRLLDYTNFDDSSKDQDNSKISV